MAILNTLPVAFTIALEPADISRNQQGMAQTRQPTAPSKDPCPQNLLLPYDNILTTPTYTSCYRAWYHRTAAHIGGRIDWIRQLCLIRLFGDSSSLYKFWVVS